MSSRLNIYVIIVILLSLLFCSHDIYCEDDDEVTVEIEDDTGSVGDSGTVAVVKEDDVLILTGENFHDVVSSKDLILVYFYTTRPECGKCKALLPEYAAAARELKKEGISIAKVYATTEKALAEKYDIKGTSFPILKLFKNGKFAENFKGTKSGAGIIHYMKKHENPNFVTPSFVKVLTAANFSDFVTKEELSLILFTSPSCQSCEKLLVEYEAAAVELLRDNIPLAIVDCSVEAGLADQYVGNKDEIPVFWLFRHGEKFIYKGPRVKVGIQRFMQRQSHLPSTLTKTQSETRNRMSKTEPCVLAYFEEEGEFYKKYIGAANRMREKYFFMHTFTPAVAEMYKLALNTVNIIFPKIYVSQYEKELKTFNQSDASVNAIETWVSTNILPLVGHRTKTNMAEGYSMRPLLVVYQDVDFYHPDITDTQYIRKKILPVADRHRDITFAFSQDEIFKAEMKGFGLHDTGEDTLAAILDERDVKYRMEPVSRFTTEALEEFVKQFKNGELKPYYKSQPAPKSQRSPLIKIVADTFEEKVLNSEDDVFIEFYAPWSSVHKKLMPTLERVAEHYVTERPNLVVAKMDALNNDVMPDFPVPSFPTFYLLKADEKDKLILYDRDGNTFDDLQAFIEEHLPKKPTKEEL